MQPESCDGERHGLRRSAVFMALLRAVVRAVPVGEAPQHHPGRGVALGQEVTLPDCCLICAERGVQYPSPWTRTVALARRIQEVLAADRDETSARQVVRKVVRSPGSASAAALAGRFVLARTRRCVRLVIG